MGVYRVVARVGLYFDVYRESNVSIDPGDLEYEGNFNSRSLEEQVEMDLAELDSNLYFEVEVTGEVEGDNEEDAKGNMEEFINSGGYTLPTLRMFGRTFEAKIDSIEIVSVEEL